VLEPVLRNCKSRDLEEIKKIGEIEISDSGRINLEKFYEEISIDQTTDSFSKVMRDCYPIIQRSVGAEKANKATTENFRSLSAKIKKKLYSSGVMEKLPDGILEEEKIILSSKEKLVKELIQKKRDLEDTYKELAETKIDKMKSNFIDVVAHELRTPLTSIKVYVELLKKGNLGEINDLQREKLEMTARNIGRLKKLIDDMLEIPMMDKEKLELREESFVVKELIEEIIDEVKESNLNRQKILIDFPDSLIIEGDRTMLGKAFKNLLVNATKYTPANGKIMVRGRKEGGKVHIEVEDNGMGIPKEELYKIFNPFYTVGKSDGGMGLGLAIVKNIVDGHRGEVWAESELNKGSVFHVLLPMKK
jgi:signal transduction histidine kinase